MFNIGDIIIGKDRSYERSLYEVRDTHEDGMATLKFICLGGRLGRDSEPYMDRPMSEFELATPQEIHTKMGVALSHTHVRFVTKLIRKSSQARQLLAMLDHLL